MIIPPPNNEKSDDRHVAKGERGAISRTEKEGGKEDVFITT
jgi:hypothetical protein